MNPNDIRERLELGTVNCFYAAIDNSPEFPGLVRSVFLAKGSRVVVEYEQHGLDEGGAYFHGEYPSVEDAMAAVEAFVGRPASEWEDMEAVGYYPPVPEGDAKSGWDALESAIRSGSVPVPPGADYKLKGSYWTQYLACPAANCFRSRV